MLSLLLSLYVYIYKHILTIPLTLTLTLTLGKVFDRVATTKDFMSVKGLVLLFLRKHFSSYVTSTSASGDKGGKRKKGDKNRDKDKDGERERERDVKNKSIMKRCKVAIRTMERLSVLESTPHVGGL